MKYFKGVVAMALGFLFNMLAMQRELFTLLILLNMTDYLTGVIHSFTNGVKFSYKDSVKGIFKKLNVLMLAMVGLTIDYVLNDYFKTDGKIYVTSQLLIWLMLQECYSIIRNTGMSDKLPKFIKKYLTVIETGVDKEDE